MILNPVIQGGGEKKYTVYEKIMNSDPVVLKTVYPGEYVRYFTEDGMFTPPFIEVKTTSGKSVEIDESGKHYYLLMPTEDVIVWIRS